jgi:alpha-tubulin suppressor-like RCC1 family protein
MPQIPSAAPLLSIRSSRRARCLVAWLALALPLTSAVAAPHMASGGSGHTQVLDGDGKVWTWGYNKYGTVGDGSTVDALPHAQTAPRQASIDNIVSIASGQGFNLAIRSDGSVWSWGYGYLGHGAYEGRLTPTQVIGVANVKQVASGLYHVLALKHDGNVIPWGNNSRGAVGDGTTTHRPSPVPSVLSGVRAVAANGHSLALKTDGTVWAWGENNKGQAGGTPGQNPSTPTRIEGLGNITAIAAGFWHSVALKNDGTVWAWGEGVALGDGRLVDSATPVQASITGVTAIAAGNGFTLALRDDGTVWAFGIVGYTGTNSQTITTVPAQVTELAGVRAIGAGMFHRMAILSDGSVYTWGMNDVGQLGNGQSGNFSNTPVRVVGSQGGSLALKTAAPLKTDVDRLFNWAELAYPHMFGPHVLSTWISGYYARCYQTGLCVGEGSGRAYLYNGGSITDVGAVEDLLNGYAVPAGF